MSDRYEIRHGKFGAYFHDAANNFDMPLDLVLEALNRKEDYKRRLANANAVDLLRVENAELREAVTLIERRSECAWTRLHARALLAKHEKT